MRIALFSWEALYAARVGGVSVHVYELARNLTREGHEVHLFTRMGEGQRLSDNVLGVHYHRCPVETRFNFIDEAEAFCESLHHYYRELESQVGGFDVIHCHDWLTFPLGFRIKSESGNRLVVTFHSTEFGRAGQMPEQPDARRIASIERAGVVEADSIVAASHEVLAELRRLYDVPEWKTRVIYHGISAELFEGNEDFDAGSIKESLGLAPLDPMGLFVGNLTFSKGPDILMQAIPKVLEKSPEVKFVFLGEGDMRVHLEREAERFGITDSIKMPGWKQGAELIDIYKAANFVCLPSRRDPFGMVALSAWSAAKPVVASSAGSPGMFIMDKVNGFIVDAEPDAFADAILESLSDFDNLRWMGANGRTAVDAAFSWTSIAQRTLEVYSQRDITV